MRAVVIGNADDLDPGFVGHRLRQHGFVFQEAHREHRQGWPDPGGVDLVLTLGSEWNVYRPELAAIVAAEAAYVREVVARRVPLLAICYGGQLLSHALGGAVSRTPTPEIGWFDVDLDRAVDGAPIAAGPWMEWHVDVFTTPEGFDVLAATDVGPQLVRGGRCLGTQFHPEATETMIRRWLAEGGAEQYRDHGGEPDELLAATRTNVERSRPAADALVDWFLDDVAGR